MAIMTLLRLPTEEELNQSHIEFETFYQEFVEKSGGSFSVDVELDGDYVLLNDYSFPKADWFSISGT